MVKLAKLENWFSVHPFSLRPCQVLRLKQGFSKSLSSQMMTPIQRVTRYTLLLREIERDLSRAGEGREAERGEVAAAHAAARDVAEYANGMMVAGRINGYNVCTIYYIVRCF